MIVSLATVFGIACNVITEFYLSEQAAIYEVTSNLVFTLEGHMNAHYGACWRERLGLSRPLAI